MGPLYCIYRNQLEDKWWDSYPWGKKKKKLHASLQLCADFTDAFYFKNTTKSSHQGSLYGWIKQNHSAEKTSRLDCYLKLEKADITSKEKLIPHQLSSPHLFIFTLLNGRFISNIGQDCLSLFTFCQIYIVLNWDWGNPAASQWSDRGGFALLSLAASWLISCNIIRFSATACSSVPSEPSRCILTKWRVRLQIGFLHSNETKTFVWRRTSDKSLKLGLRELI